MDKQRILNPITGKYILVNGRTHRNLLKNGTQFHTNSIQCPEGKAYNTHTKRFVKIGSRTYSEAKKNGWIVENFTQYKNLTTFLANDDIFNIPVSDRLITDDNYFFSITELKELIKRDDFNNINPHDDTNTVTLFTRDDIHRYKKLSSLLTKYFKRVDAANKRMGNVYENTLDLLYLVGNVGRICYFNRLTEYDDKDSSHFENSIKALHVLSVALTNLKENNHINTYRNIKQIVDDANKGNTCIHGVGMLLMAKFIEMFLKTDPERVKYDVAKTNLMFIKKNNRVIYVSNEHRFYLNPDTYHINRPISALNKLLIDPKICSRLLSDRFMDQKSKHYQQISQYDTYLVTLNGTENWIDVPDWRKICLSDNGCFDLLFLTVCITNDLNISKNTNPYPRFPKNPFTQREFSPAELNYIRNSLYDNYIIISKPLELFLYNSRLWNYESENWTEQIVTFYENNKLRFVRKNNIVNDTLECIGFWDDKFSPMDYVEKDILKYINYINMPALERLKKLPNYVIPDSYYYRYRKISSNCIEFSGNVIV